jgi:hypothetical protein
VAVIGILGFSIKTPVFVGAEVERLCFSYNVRRQVLATETCRVSYGSEARKFVGFGNKMARAALAQATENTPHAFEAKDKLVRSFAGNL